MKIFDKIYPLSIALVFLLSVKANSQAPTWAEKIAPILYKNCTNCHRTGGLAPFPLMTYPQARNTHLAIHHAVLTGHMPPWPPDPKYSQFAFQRPLSEADKQAILDWANADAPSGDLSKAPPTPVYTSSFFIPTPDWVQRAPKYTITSNRDDYRCFPIRSNVLTDKFITQMEVVPGNGKIVHHVLVFQDQANTCFTLDARDTLPGYASFGGVGSNSATLIAGWVPGSQPFAMPRGMGVRLKANANIIIQVHYAPGSTGQSDSTQVRLKLADGPMREVQVTPILNHQTSLTNGPLSIPPNTVKTFNASFNLPAILPNDATLISIAPHMHMIGTRIKSWATTPSRDTIRLINIPRWDFHWQGSYLFKKAIKLVRGSTLFAEATYDNTVNNINNPNNPPKTVNVGESTTDEMMLVYFTYTAYQAGDENIDLESAVTGVEAPLSKTDLLCYPNPTSGHLTLRFDLAESQKLNIEIFDYQGIVRKLVSDGDYFSAGRQELNFATDDLANGVYFARIQSNKTYGVQQFVVIK
jgi:mono/diheme cytochrome c family protein